MTTRLPRPRCVRATTASPSRRSSRCAYGRRADSIASAIAVSSPETEAMSTSRRVSSRLGRVEIEVGHRASLRSARADTLGGMTTAWGHGLATTATSTGTVLDTWFPSPRLGAPPAGGDVRRPGGARAVGGRGRPPRGHHRPRHAGHRPGCCARVHSGRLPPTAPAEPPARRPEHDQPRRDLRPPSDRGVDDGRPDAPRGVRPPPPGPAASRDLGARHRQVPATARLRHTRPGADRGRVAGAARRAPRAGHDGDARGLRQLQRGHSRHLHGRGPDLPGRRGRRRLGCRGRRIHHGHPVGRRDAARQSSADAPCSERTPASASRSATTRSSRRAST